jgi:hypothetical protein
MSRRDSEGCGCLFVLSIFLFPFIVLKELLKTVK